MLICNVVVYTLVWEDHDRQYHLSLADGRLRRLKCVKHHSDDDDDAIQKAMDLAYESHSSVMMRDSQLQIWQRRLASSWGHRHWRCEEWLESCPCYSERTMFLPMMLLCKQMYPEIMESIFESHTFLFNEMPAVYRFFVAAPSLFIGSIRSLDITLVLPYAEYRSYDHIGGTQPARQLEALRKALTKITFRDLRISLDVRDRQCWRKLPESGILNRFGKVNVLNKYIVELPALLPGQSEHHENFHVDESTLQVRRRPPIRYWNFNPRKVERLTWKVAEGAKTTCWITSDTMGYIPNPYHDAT
ncbi:hypothetical protein PG996_009741 [Apiospora saccharicola]|uniref:DUF7730 domain-containing protein n=1 Tax=Apiospora saccharicola TaxID=335842 RepID=A0ABR1UP40_9PEZI